MNNASRDMTDGERVIHTANLENISELEVFERAHRNWYGRDSAVAEMEQAFVAYLYFGETPLWVRHYTRSVLRDGIAAESRGRWTSVFGGALARLTETRLARFLAQ